MTIKIAHRPTSLPQRFWTYVVKGEECWTWTGAHSATGYARFAMNGNSRLAYRVLWVSIHGPVPAGLVLDHLCRNRGCVNPDHLEAVTQRENLLRGDTQAAKRSAQTECLRGHSLTDPHNVYISKRGERICRACKRLQQAKYNLQNREG